MSGQPAPHPRRTRPRPPGKLRSRRSGGSTPNGVAVPPTKKKNINHLIRAASGPCCGWRALTAHPPPARIRWGRETADEPFFSGDYLFAGLAAGRSVQRPQEFLIETANGRGPASAISICRAIAVFRSVQSGPTRPGRQRVPPSAMERLADAVKLTLAAAIRAAGSSLREHVTFKARRRPGYFSGQ